MLDPSVRKRLLDIARDSIIAKIGGGTPPKIGSADSHMGQDQGAFVTIKQMGRLRGCIGTFEGKGSLAATVQEMALAAAFNDPRFPPLRNQAELEWCDLEVSVLSRMENATPESVEVGRHGLYVTKGFNRGVLLPQVATENHWDREQFLEGTCLKAGLPADAWKQAGIKIMTFTAEVFSEEDLKK